jgi:hypothetical protein
MRVISSLNRAFALRNIASYKPEESVTYGVTFNRFGCARSIKTLQETAGGYRAEAQSALDVPLMTAFSNFPYTKTCGYTAIAFHILSAPRTISAPTRGRRASDAEAGA